jgi:hypothetical protein
MQDKPTPENLTRSEPSPWEGAELAALNLLTDPCHYPTLWSMEDIGRELEHRDPEAIVRPLVNAGLLYRMGDALVFATPAAFHLTSLVGHVV